MRPKVLFLISTDPRVSHRPAEAIRIAAGISVGMKAEVTVVLLGPAVRAVGEDTSSLMDEENYHQYLPVLVESRSRFCVAREESLPDAPNALVPTEKLERPQLSALAAASTYLLRF